MVIHTKKFFFELIKSLQYILLLNIVILSNNQNKMKIKNRIVMLLVLVSFLQCKQKEDSPIITEKLSTKNLKVSAEKEDSTNNLKKNNSETLQAKIEADTLIPIEIQDKKSNNVYEKYGLEFSGNCYDCDLATFKIDKQKICITNVCDKEINESLEILKTESSEDEVTIETKNHRFLFKRVHNEPIYLLKITKGTFEVKNLRTSKFFTVKKSLKKFKVHDCGEFQG